MELEELLAMARGGGDPSAAPGNRNGGHYLTVPKEPEQTPGGREPNPASLLGELTRENAELKAENERLVNSLQTLVGKLGGQKDSSLSNASKSQQPEPQIDPNLIQQPGFQVTNQLFGGNARVNEPPGGHRNGKISQATSVGLESRHSNTLEKAPLGIAQDVQNGNHHYFQTAKSTNSIKHAGQYDSAKAVQTVPVPNAPSAGQRQLRLNNVQVNVAAGKVLKKKKLVEAGSEGNHQRGQASIRLSGKTLLTQKQPKVVLNTQSGLQNGQSGIQRVIKQNLIRVKQAQIDFDKHNKQPLNIRLVPSSKAERSGGSSKRVGPAQPHLQLHKQQHTVAHLAQSKPRNYSSEA